MWHSAMAAAVVLTQQHLLVGGLGGVIAVIVGVVVSIIAARASKRSVARPAANPQPAPASRRPATSPVYGAPAPPTSPARRLHPGPISLGAPTRPQRDDDEPIATSLFNPDIFGGAHTEPEETLAELGAEARVAAPTAPSGPHLRSISSVTAEWRPQATPALPPELTHAPIWNRSPFAWPDTGSEEPPASAINFESAPPIWNSLGDRMATGESLRPDAAAPASLAPFASHAPIWQSRLSGLAAATPASDDSAPSELVSDDAGGAREESAPPIWPSFLRPE